MVEGTTLSVHRCRFVDFTPSAVTALAFPPLPLPSVKGKKTAAPRKALKFGTLAVGRANGNIEICEWTGTDNQIQAPQAWAVKKTLSGPYPSKVDSLAFTIRFPDTGSDEVPSCADLRLFSAGGGSDLAEWDVERGCIKRTIPSQGGSIWSIAPNPASTLLALGCEDGSVRLVSLEHDTLTHLRRLDRVKSRILSLAWGPPLPREASQMPADTSDDEDEDEWTDSWLVAGCSDSSVRKWDAASGRVLDRMGTDKMRGERTLVWAVNVLGDGTIVSGDSLGTVKFWDSRTCTQLQSFQAHGADVLCLTVSPEGTAVYSSGVDQKVIQYSLVKTSQPAPVTPTTPSVPSPRAPSRSRWVQSSTRRMHTHDVRSLAIWPPHTPLPPSHAHTRRFAADVAPILASGGLDMSVVLTPAALTSSTVVAKVVNPLSTSVAATFDDAYHRRVAYPPTAGGGGVGGAGSAVGVARGARVVVCLREAGVSLWRIPTRRKGGEDEDMGDSEERGAHDQEQGSGWEKVLDMELNVHTNLVAGAISDDGKWLVVSDSYESKLFRLETLDNGDVKPRRIRDFSSILQPHLPSALGSTGGSAFSFTPDSTKLVMASTMSSYILIIDLSDSDNKPCVLRKFDHHRRRYATLGDRVVKNGKGKGKKAPASHSQKDGDVEMADADATAPESESESESEDEQGEKPLATIARLAISPDSQWLATSDTHSHTHVFHLDGLTYHTTLPTLPAPIHALSFARAPHLASVLVLGLANNSIHVFDVESRQFPTWARALTSALPQRFVHLHDPILGVAFDPGSGAAGSAQDVARGATHHETSAGGSKGREALFWGSTWMCRIQLDASVGFGGFEKKRRRKHHQHQHHPHPQHPHPHPNQSEHQAQGQQQNFKIVTHYRPLLFVDFLGPAELVVVERPLVDVLAKLPPAYFKPKYGAS